MSDYDQHIILHHLDDPLRFLHWTLDEAMSITGPAFFGLAVEHPLLGLIGSGVCYWALTTTKKRFGFESLKHALYWHLPKSDQRLPNTPPSYIREYLG